jgi:hypothetical protein
MMSESFRGMMQNPTVVAMLGSTAIHGLLVVTSAFSPAESQSVDQLRIVNLAPPSSSTNDPSSKPNPNNNLLVPNDLPPISLGEVPQMAPLPDLSQFSTPNIPPSQSFYAGDARSLSVGKLPTTNPPQRSVQVSRLPTYGVPNFRTPNYGTPNLGSSGLSSSGGNPPPSPNGLPNSNGLPNNGAGLIPPQSVLGPLSEGTFPGSGSAPSGQSSAATQPNYPGYNVSRNPGLPQLSGEPLRNSDLVDLYARPNPENATAKSPVENPSVNPASPGAVTPGTRDSFKKLLQERSAAIGQPLSAQTGPRLTAAYPASACGTKQDGLAIISAVYGPKGALATDFKAIQVVQPAATPALNQAAIAAVKAQPQPAAAGIYQAFNYTVDIPYSAAACGRAATPAKPVQTSPAPSSLPVVPKPTKIPLPSTPPVPLSAPTAIPSPIGKPIAPQASPSPRTSPSLPGAASPAPVSSPKPSSAFPSPDFIPSREVPPPSKPSPDASVAPPRPQPQPSPVETTPQATPPTGDIGPLPSPAITAPETPQPQ